MTQRPLLRWMPSVLCAVEGGDVVANFDPKTT